MYLYHVIKNIIQNSIDAFSSKNYDNEISINIEYKDHLVNKIIIQDNAGGIKISNIKQIFEPNITTKKTGMGIGLSIVKHIVQDKLKGNVNVENIEKGVRFTITLPIS